MLARLQRRLVFALAAAAMLWAAISCAVGRCELAWIGAALVIGGYGAALGIEFTLMRWVNRADPAPAPSPGQLAGAWWHELCSGPVVFGWRQPFRSRRWPDRAAAGTPGQRGVVFLHGFVCNRGLWNPWLQRLHAQQRPFVAVDLEPPFGSIDDYPPAIDRAVRQLHDGSGLAPVVVAHSMGGLALRRWWSQPGHRELVHHAITIGTPHHGTWLARLSFTSNGRQMRPGGPWLRELARSEHAGLACRFTCFYSHCDNIVFPASTATLDGADNRHLPGVAHVQMVDRSEPYDELMRRLAD